MCRLSQKTHDCIMDTLDTTAIHAYRRSTCNTFSRKISKDGNYRLSERPCTAKPVAFDQPLREMLIR